MSKKGQALVEALAGLGLSILFFISCIKLWMTAANELKTEINLREKQICELSLGNKCSPDAGFVLVTLLMQLSVLVFSAHVLLVLFIHEEFKWKVSNWCFESGLAAIAGNPTGSSDEVLKIERGANEAGRGIVQFNTRVNGPFRSGSPNGLSESFYEIEWSTTTKINPEFLNAADYNSRLKCGARKLCEDKKCIYSLIADKS